MKVSVQGGTGTGFVISREHRLILTARHCIEHDGKPQDTIRLTFPNPRSSLKRVDPFPATGTRIAHGEQEADWALLRADQLPDWSTEVRLLDIPVQSAWLWSTLGFPADRGDGEELGLPAEGEVKLGGDSVLPMLLDETIAGNHVAGHSGGAAVVDEYSHGIITRADQTTGGKATTGRLYMLPLEQCHKLAEQADVVIHPEPAFLERATEIIEQGKALRDFAFLIYRERVEHVPRIARYIAIEILLNGLSYIKRLIVETRIGRLEAGELAEYAACQWYSSGEAKRAAERLRDGVPSRVVSVACASNDCATRLIRRGGFASEGSHNWHAGRIDVAWPSYEPVQYLIDRIGDELAQPRCLDFTYTTPADARTALARHMAKGRIERHPPVFFIVLPAETNDDDVQEVEAAYPQLGIVVLGPPRAGAFVVSIDQATARGQVQQYDQLCDELDTMFSPSTRRTG